MAHQNKGGIEALFVLREPFHAGPRDRVLVLTGQAMLTEIGDTVAHSHAPRIDFGIADKRLQRSRGLKKLAEWNSQFDRNVLGVDLKRLMAREIGWRDWSPCCVDAGLIRDGCVGLMSYQRVAIMRAHPHKGLVRMCLSASPETGPRKNHQENKDKAESAHI